MESTADRFHVIVFSKDRAFQLHEYLRTLKLHLRGSSGSGNSSGYRLRVSVLYRAPPTGSHFEQSYYRVRALHPDVAFHAERGGAEFSVLLRQLVASRFPAPSCSADGDSGDSHVLGLEMVEPPTRADVESAHIVNEFLSELEGDGELEGPAAAAAAGASVGTSGGRGAGARGVKPRSGRVVPV